MKDSKPDKDATNAARAKLAAREFVKDSVTDNVNKGPSISLDISRLNATVEFDRDTDFDKTVTVLHIPSKEWTVDQWRYFDQLAQGFGLSDMARATLVRELVKLSVIQTLLECIK
jgi:hypothetical protein